MKILHNSNKTDEKNFFLLSKPLGADHCLDVIQQGSLSWQDFIYLCTLLTKYENSSEIP